MKLPKYLPEQLFHFSISPFPSITCERLSCFASMTILGITKLFSFLPVLAILLVCRGFLDGSVVKNLPPTAGNAGSIPWLGRSPGEGNGNPLQYSWLANPMDRGAWSATVHGVAKSIRQDLATQQQYVDESNCQDSSDCLVCAQYSHWSFALYVPYQFENCNDLYCHILAIIWMNLYNLIFRFKSFEILYVLAFIKLKTRKPF